MNLPTGTVTFLFTDIEGSTKLWERCPEAMRLALARHDVLLREAIEGHSGCVFKTVGDAFCAAFPNAPDALYAALDTQLSLQAQEWGETGPLKVRMGLHTGEAEERDNDYFGPTLNRAARLQSIAYGGQTLVSQATYELARDRLPNDVKLQPLGLHRLKDLNRAEQVHEILHPQLPADFPPLRSLDSFPNNLPIQLTRFVGREPEMEAIRNLLTAHSLITLLGPGGTGKTRLSMQVGADMLERFPDGVWLIELAALSDPTLVAQAVASVIGAKEAAGCSLTQTLVETLKPRATLLILDNCEHLIASCARFAQTLLQSCPHLQILASSRESLNIPGENLYRVPSLRLPDPKKRHTLASLSQFEAVQLFVDRAVCIQSAFAVTNQNAPALAQLCSRLDGIPLAIELAAARIRSLSVEEINAKLDNCFRLLTGGSRTALPRQQTLRALIDWSYDMLAEPEKTLLRRLSVFAGGWFREAAAFIGAGEEGEDWEVLDLLTELSDKSLVVAEQEGEHTRYRLLETIRQYARDRLTESGEAETIRRQHHAWFARVVEETSTRLAGAEQQAALDTLEKEHDNLRAALEWAIAKDADTALPMAATMGTFWYLGGYLREGREQLERALAIRPTEQTPANQVEACFQIGRLGVEQSDFQFARPYLERCVTLARQTGNKRRAASALNSLGIITLQQGEYAPARSLFEESLLLHRSLGNMTGIASALSNLGYLVQDQGDYAAAIALEEESRAISEKLGDKRGVANALINLGSTLYFSGEIDKARVLTEQSLAIGQELNDEWYCAYSLYNMAMILKHQGDYARARQLAEESLAILRSIGDIGETALALALLGEISCVERDTISARSLFEESLALQQQLGQKNQCVVLLESFAALAVAMLEKSTSSETTRPKALQATRLLGAAEAHRTLLGMPLHPIAQPAYAAGVKTLQSLIVPEDFAAAWAGGKAMTLEQAIACALSDSN